MNLAVPRREFPSAWLGSMLLHGLVAAAALISWSSSEPMQAGTVVPVKIVTNAAATNLRPAIEAPEVQTAQAEEPVPDAPRETVAPTPDPTPPTPVPTPPTPKPAPTPPTPKPAPAPPAPKTPQKTVPTPKAPAPKAPPQKTTPAPAPKAAAPKAPPQKAQPTDAPSLDLAALQKELQGMRPSGGRRSSAPKGQNRPETDRQARPDAGEGLAASSIPGLQEQLSELWNPNCQVQGGRDARVQVTFIVGPGGKLQGKPSAGGQEFTTGVARVAAERAINSVLIAESRGHLSVVPRGNYGKPITARFDPSQCS